jgi:hypothetical protein
MTIARTIAQRIAEAEYLVVSTDADLLSLVGGDATRIRLRNFFFDPSSISAPQIDVALVPTVGWQYSLGVVTDMTVPVRVTYWFNAAGHRSLSLGQDGETWPESVLHHIVALTNASGDGQGRLVDPDAAAEADGVAKWLNHVLQPPQWGIVRPEESTLVGFYVDLPFETRADISGERI